MRLILGAGKHTPKEEGDIFVDIRPFHRVDTVHDLNKIPWPFPDNTYSHVSAIHLVEHLQSLLDFMNEAWRVLAKGGSMYVVTPHAGKDTELEFADPTHVRCYTKFSIINYFTLTGIEQWGYTDKAWAILNIDCPTEGEHKNCLVFLVTPIK